MKALKEHNLQEINKIQSRFHKVTSEMELLMKYQEYLEFIDSLVFPIINAEMDYLKLNNTSTHTRMSNTKVSEYMHLSIPSLSILPPFLFLY